MAVINPATNKPYTDAEIAAIVAQNVELSKQPPLKMRVGPSGTIHITGLNGKWGVSPYPDQAVRLRELLVSDLDSFTEKNKHLLSFFSDSAEVKTAKAAARKAAGIVAKVA